MTRSKHDDVANRLSRQPPRTDVAEELCAVRTTLCRDRHFAQALRALPGRWLGWRGGGLFSTAEDYLQFAQMLLNDGQLNGRQLLGRRAVEMMRSMYAPDTLPGRPRGEGYGLSVRVVVDLVARNTFVSEGTFGWSGLFGTHFFIDPQEKVVGVLMAQTSAPGITGDFENAVMQAIVGTPVAAGTN